MRENISKEHKRPTTIIPHDWEGPRLGKMRCKRCLMTDLDATALGEYKFCRGAKNPVFTTVRNKNLDKL